jgi:hypothetical protein
MVCPPEAGARPLEGHLSLQINECLGAISFEKAFSIHMAGGRVRTGRIFSLVSTLLLCGAIAGGKKSNALDK